MVTESKETKIQVSLEPVFEINFTDLEQAAVHLEDKQTILGILTNIKQEISHVEKFFPISNKKLYYPEVRHLLEAISRQLEKIPSLPGLHHSIRQTIQKAITPLQTDIHQFFLQEEGVSDDELLLRTQALYAQQAFIMREGSINKALQDTLTAIKQTLPEKSIGMRCFISYAWPMYHHQPKEEWLQPFLRVLHTHLSQAGIKPRLDIADNKVGDNIGTFTQYIARSEFAVLICTDSLWGKHHDLQFKVVQTELSLLRQKYDMDIATGQVRVFPLLVSGSRASALLPEHHLYRTVRDWRNQSYLKNLEQLIAWICYPQGTSEAYQKIWQDFYIKYAALANWMPKKQVEEELALQWHKREMEVIKNEDFYQRFMEQQKGVVKLIDTFPPSAAENVVASHSSLGLDSSDERKEVKQQSSVSEQTLTTQLLGESWHLPSRNDLLFTGRVNELKKLNEIFAAKKEAKTMVLSAVSGLGGIGKTQLAIYQIHHPEHPYSLRIWFQAETDTILHKEFLEFAQAYHLPLEEKAPRHEVIRAVKRYLAQQPSWLIVYDNAGEHAVIKDFLLDGLNNGHRIITTRRTEWHDMGDKLEVDVFSEAEAIAYIKKLLQRDETQYSKSEAQALTELVYELGRLPLALAQAGAYIKKRNKSIENYLAMYRTQTAAMLADKTLPTNSNVQPVATTWNITLKAIQEDEAVDTKEAGEPTLSLLLLQAMSYLHSDHISFDLLARWLYTSRLVVDQAAVERLLDKALGYLSVYSMIQSHIDQKSVSIHRLVQEVVRFQLQSSKTKIPTTASLESKGDAKTTPSEESRHSFLLVSLTGSSLEEFNLETQILVDEKRQKALLTHLQALVKHHDASGSSSTSLPTDLGRLLVSVGNVFTVQLGDASQAKVYYERALEMLEQQYGKDSWQRAAVLVNLAVVYGALGDPTKQKQLLEEALKIQGQHQEYPYKEDRWQKAVTLGNLANAYGSLGNAPKQKQLLEDALKIETQLYGENDWRVAGTLNNLATAYGALGYLVTQKKLLERALTIQGNHYGKDHPQVAITLNNLANAYGFLGSAEMQKQLSERALKIQEKHYGKDHWRVASTLNSLATAYSASEDAVTQNTIQLLKRALTIQENHYGKDHPEVAITLNNLAIVHKNLRDTVTQKKLLERALEIQEKHYGKDHWQVASVLDNLATAYDTLKDAPMKKQLLERALKIKEQHYGKDHWQVAMTLNGLAIAYQQLSDIATALRYAREVYRIFTASFKNPDHPHIKTAEENLQIYSSLQQAVSNLCSPIILGLLQQGDRETARYHFESENMNFDDSKVHVQLAECYIRQKHFSGAIIHLEQALSLAQHAKRSVARLSQLHGQLACVYLCHHAELKQTEKPLTEQQQAQTLAKKHFEEGIKGLADFKATDAGFLLKKDAYYSTMIAKAIGGNVIAVRQVLEYYMKTLSPSSVESGAGDAKVLVPDVKQNASGLPEAFSKDTGAQPPSAGKKRPRDEKDSEDIKQPATKSSRTISTPPEEEFFEDTRDDQQSGWNCFDVAAGLQRSALVAFALEHAESKEYRQLLEPEIRNAAAVTAILLNLKDREEEASWEKVIQISELFALLDTAHQFGEKEDQQRIEKQINKMFLSETDSDQNLSRFALPKSMQTTEVQALVNNYNNAHERMRTAVAQCNKSLGIIEGPKKSQAQLDTFFQHAANCNQHRTAYELFAKTRAELFTPHEQAFFNYCSCPDIYLAYVSEYYGQNQWFAFQPATASHHQTSMVDIAARFLGAQIIVHQRTGRERRVMYSTASQSKKIHIQFNGYGHFVALIPPQASVVSQIDNFGFLPSLQALTAASASSSHQDPDGDTIMETGKEKKSSAALKN